MGHKKKIKRKKHKKITPKDKQQKDNFDPQKAKTINNILYFIIDAIILGVLYASPENGFTALLFLFGLIVNDIYALQIIKYGAPRISRLFTDSLRYFYVSLFNLSYLFIFVLLVMRIQAVLHSYKQPLIILTFLSVIGLFYFLPAYLSIGRLILFEEYVGKTKKKHRNFLDAEKEGLKKAAKFTIKPRYLYILGLFYGLMFILDLFTYHFPTRVGQTVFLAYLFAMYAFLPIIGKGIYEIAEKQRAK